MSDEFPDVQRPWSQYYHKARIQKLSSESNQYILLRPFRPPNNLRAQVDDEFLRRYKLEGDEVEIENRTKKEPLHQDIERPMKNADLPDLRYSKIENDEIMKSHFAQFTQECIEEIEKKIQALSQSDGHPRVQDLNEALLYFKGINSKIKSRQDWSQYDLEAKYSFLKPILEDRTIVMRPNPKSEDFLDLMAILDKGDESEHIFSFEQLRTSSKSLFGINSICVETPSSDSGVFFGTAQWDATGQEYCAKSVQPKIEKFLKFLQSLVDERDDSERVKKIREKIAAEGEQFILQFDDDGDDSDSSDDDGEENGSTDETAQGKGKGDKQTKNGAKEGSMKEKLVYYLYMLLFENTIKVVLIYTFLKTHSLLSLYQRFYALSLVWSQYWTM